MINKVYIYIAMCSELIDKYEFKICIAMQRINSALKRVIKGTKIRAEI